MARRRETVQVSLLLLILLVIFFGKAIFTGQKLLPADIAFADPVYSAHAPPGFTESHNSLLYDQTYQFYPWRVQVTQELRQGTLPFWNPYVYCGTPLLAEDQPAVFYPLNLLSYVFSPPDAVLFTAFGRLFVAGLATYWFLRTIGGQRFGALLGAITFTFSGFMIVWLGHPHTNVAAWLPALFLTLQWLHSRVSSRHVALVALVIAVQLTGGHSETALYTLTAGGAYYLFQVLSFWWGKRQMRAVVLRIMAFAVAAILGFALASVHLLPFWEWLQHSAELQFRAGTGSLRLSSLGPRYWLAGMLPAVLPNVFNNPTWPGEYRSFFPGWNFVEQTLYVGVIGLSLAAVAVTVRLCDQGRPRVGQRRLIWFVAVLGLVALGAALRVPIFDWVNQLPLFHIAAYGRFRLIYSFCISLLAGFGSDDLMRHATKDSARRMAIWFLGALTVAGMLILAFAPSVLSRLATLAPGLQIRQLLQGGIARAFHPANVRMYWPLLVAAAGIWLLVLSRSRYVVRRPWHQLLCPRNIQLILALLVLADLFALGMNYHGTIPREFVFPETGALALVKSDQDIFRILGTNVDLMPNTSMIYSLQDVRGLDFPSDRYRQFCHAVGGHDWLGYGILFGEVPPPRLLGMLNTKYVLSSAEPSAPSLAELRLLAQDGAIRVYENPSWLPRAFVVHRVRVCEDGGSALTLLQDPDLYLDAEIVLAKSPPPEFVQAAPPQGDGAQAGTFTLGSADITHYEANRVVIQARSPRDGFLFLSDAYYPGWRAYVDGAEREIYQANYAFRAVYLPAGEHAVEFVYQPESFKVGAVISVCALLGTLLLLASRYSEAGPASEAR